MNSFFRLALAFDGGRRVAPGRRVCNRADFDRNAQRRVGQRGLQRQLQFFFGRRLVQGLALNPQRPHAAGLATKFGLQRQLTRQGGHGFGGHQPRHRLVPDLAQLQIPARLRCGERLGFCRNFNPGRGLTHNQIRCNFSN